MSTPSPSSLLYSSTESSPSSLSYLNLPSQFIIKLQALYKHTLEKSNLEKYPSEKYPREKRIRLNFVNQRDDSEATVYLHDSKSEPLIVEMPKRFLKLKEIQSKYKEVAEFSIEGEFSDPVVQQLTLEILKVHGQGITTIYFDQIVGEFECEVLNALPNLNKVTLKCSNDINCSIYTNFLRHIQTHCPSIKHVSILFDWSADWTIDISPLSSLVVNTILEGLSSISHLERVSLNRMRNHSELSLEMLFSPQSQLKSISLEDCRLSEEDISMIFENCKNLEEFFTAYCERLPMEFHTKYPNVRIRQYCYGD